MSAQQEAVKLTATWINNISLLVVGAGVIKPALSAHEALADHSLGAIYFVSIILFALAGWGVHQAGRDWLLVRYEE